jgi:hypothetical protein
MEEDLAARKAILRDFTPDSIAKVSHLTFTLRQK